MIDISERKQTEELLKYSEKHYKELADSITDVFFEMDKDMRYTFWNKASENLIGIPAQVAIGKSIDELFPDIPEIRKAKAVYLKVIQTQQPSIFESILQLGQKIIVFEMRAYPTFSGIAVFSTDITHRIKAEEAMARQNEALSKLNHFAIELAALSLEDDIEAFITKQIKEMSGAVGVIFSDYDSVKRVTSVKHIEIKPGLLKKIVGLIGKDISKIQSVIDDEVYREMTIEMVGMRKSLYEMSMGAIPRRVASAIQSLLKIDRFIGLAYIIEGKLYGTSVLAMGKDQPDLPKEILQNFTYLATLTLRRRKVEKALKENMNELAIINQELEQFTYANQELKQFAYIASHQLQEPVRTISNYIQIMEEDYSDQLDIKAQEHFKTIKEASNRMALLINSLLEFSRLGRSKKLVRVDCKQLINTVIADLEYLITSSNAIIEIEEMPALKLYETEVHQLFQNLITNAIKFQKKGNQPKIQIRSEKIKDKWKFSVSDNGIGIAPIHYERIFDIFQRLHKNEEEYEGKGIGLAYCRKIVHLHQGEIWVESNAVSGVTFHFTLKAS